MKIVFFGTPQFAADALEFLVDNGVQVVAVVTRPDKPKGRSGTPQPTPVKVLAEAVLPSVPVYQPEKASALEFAEVLKALNADLFVVAAYGEIVKQHLLDIPRLGCINLHASLLPRYRGAAPIQRAIIEGDLESGATIMHMVLKMDAGNIIKMVHVPIGPEMTAGELEVAICKAGSIALLEVVHEFSKERIEGIPQNESQVTYAPKIELEDCEIDWHRPAQEIHDLIRGTNPHPGAWCVVSWRNEKKRLKIFRSQIVTFSAPPGTIISEGKEGIIVACGKDALRLQEVQLEGKKAMLASDLIRGVPLDLFSFIV